MSNPEANQGHTQFFCSTTLTGSPFALRFDPAMLSDDVTKIMLKTQINYVAGGHGFISVTTSDSKGNATEKKINPSMLTGKDRNKGDGIVRELFAGIAKADIIRVVITRRELAAKKFIENEMDPRSFDSF